MVSGAFAATGTPASAATSANEICRMDAVTLAEKIRTKQLSPTEVTEAILMRMDRVNPVIGAFCTPAPDVARAQAKAVEADIMAGKSVGPLAADICRQKAKECERAAMRVADPQVQFTYRQMSRQVA